MKYMELKTEDELTEAFNNPNTAIYFREGNQGDYESAIGFTKEVLSDGTVHGFELVAVVGLPISQNVFCPKDTDEKVDSIKDLDDLYEDKER